jgi:predicted LPLAT superfamily acyltransferase
MPVALRLSSPKMLLASALSLGAGFFIAWVDTRPSWDDTGVTAGMLFLAAAASAFARTPFWLAAIFAVGPILAFELAGGWGVLLGVPFAVAGAAAGALLRRLT